MMDHFLSGLDHGQNPWYSPRPVANAHEFAIGNSSFQLIPISGTGLTTGDTLEFCNSNSGSDSNSTNTHSAFRPLHEVKIKTEGDARGDDDKQDNPSVALAPLSTNRAHSHKNKSGERWDTKKVCNICGKVLSRGDKLKNHIRTHSNHYPYHCETCGLGFLRSEGLRVHTRIHTGERPYVCLLCGKAYTRKDKLTRHAIVHTGERPFVCQHCGKSFTRKDKCQRHELIHRVDKPFTCSPCNLEFVRQETLNMHLEKKHPERLPYTLVHNPPPRADGLDYHPQGLDLSNLIDSKSGIVKVAHLTGKVPSTTASPSTSTTDSSSSSSSTNSTTTTTTASSSITVPNNVVLSHGATLLCSPPLYTGVPLPSSTTVAGTSLLHSASAIHSNSFVNGYSGPPFPSAAENPSGGSANTRS